MLLVRYGKISVLSPRLAQATFANRSNCHEECKTQRHSNNNNNNNNNNKWLISVMNLSSFAMLQNGVLRCWDISKPEPKLVEQIDIGCSVSSLNWSPNYRTMALGSSKVIMLYFTCNRAR